MFNFLPHAKIIPAPFFLLFFLTAVNSFSAFTAKPTNTKIVLVSTNSFSVAWKEKNSGVVSYAIFAATNSAFDSIVSSAVFTDPASDVNKVTTTTFGGLIPNTLYWVCVRAKAQTKEISSCSAADSASTLALAPSDIHVLKVGISSITVSWILPARGSAGFEVQGSVDPSFENTVSSKTLSGIITTLTLKNLNSDTTYYLRVGAINADQVVNFSQTSLVAQTDFVLGPAPDTPTRTQAVWVTSTSIAVSWKEKNLGSLLYRVIASTNEINPDASIASWTDFRDDQSDVNKIAVTTITNLTPNERYWVFARALKERSRVGNYSSPDRAVTLAQVPSELLAVPVNDRDYWLRWDSGGNSPSTIYELTQSMDDFQTLVSTVVPWTANFKENAILVQGLLPGVAYALRVRAKNQEGVVTDYAKTTIAPFGAGGFLTGAITRNRKTELQLKDGKTSLSFPANAFSKDAIMIASTDPIHHPIHAIPARLSRILEGVQEKRSLRSTLREFSAMLSNEEFQGEFNGSVGLSISYAAEDADGDGFIDGMDPPISVEQLALWHIDEQKEILTPCPNSRVDRLLQKVSCNPRHFSTYVVLVNLQPKAVAGEIYAYPVPWRPNDNDPANGTSLGITFGNVSGNGEIKIFTVNGDWARTLYFNGASAVVWDGRNDRGDYLASGVYLWSLKSDLVAKTGKLIIIR